MEHSEINVTLRCLMPLCCSFTWRENNFFSAWLHCWFLSVSVLNYRTIELFELEGILKGRPVQLPCGCPCSLQRSWTGWPLRVSSDSNDSMTFTAQWLLLLGSAGKMHYCYPECICLWGNLFVFFWIHLNFYFLLRYLKLEKKSLREQPHRLGLWVLLTTRS